MNREHVRHESKLQKNKNQKRKKKKEKKGKNRKWGDFCFFAENKGKSIMLGVPRERALEEQKHKAKKKKKPRDEMFF